MPREITTDYLSLEQLKRLLSYVSGKPYELAIWLGVYLGLRVGEIQALRWQDVDFEKQLIHIRRTYSKHEYKFRDYPKGKKHHSVCIPSELLNLLEQESSKATGELVVQPPNYKMLDYWTYRKVLKQYCIEANVPVVATHGLRHSTSELYMAHGATRDDLRILFAHSAASVTDRYIHDRGSRLEKVAQQIRLFPSGTKMEQNGVIRLRSFTRDVS